ncbi:MAG TPA: NADPH:quinone oxidoreductase family protein [Burkholderiales bacterium]|nr:NADPH:quinone oxidoreductase family protein [Burkholderiales bacterium]
MKAVLCKEWGPPDALVVEDIPSPKPGKGQLLVSVKASGVNFPDVLLIQNKYQFKPELPFSPGSEIAGVVKQVGEGVHGFMPGDRVMAHIRSGGYAEEAVVDEALLAPVPAGLDFTVAASFGLVYATAYHALKDRAAIRSGETLLVLGAAGGVGLAAVELGKLLGARVIACASSDEKLETCKRFGAEVAINYEREDLREALKNLGRAVDIALDPVGGKYSEPAVRAMAWKGRYLVVGFASGEIPKIPLNLTLLKGCSIVGVFWGEFARRERDLNAANLRELTAWLRAGKIKPLVSASYPLARAADALNDMMNRKVQGKVVLTTDY